MSKPIRGYLTNEEQIEIVQDALAAVRFYRRIGGGASVVQPIQEVVRHLKAVGKTHDVGPHGCILTTAADAISKTYLSVPADRTLAELGPAVAYPPPDDGEPALP